MTCIPVLIPHDCTDGFIDAFWGRPEVYRDPSVRNSMSAFQLLNPVELVQGIAQLRADLKHGRWDEQFGKLRNQESMDAGLRLVVAHLSGDRVMKAATAIRPHKGFVWEAIMSDGNLTKQRIEGAMLVLLSGITISTKAILAKLAYRLGADALQVLSLRMFMAVPLFLLTAYFSEKDRAA